MRNEKYKQKSVRITSARIGYRKRSNWLNPLLIFLTFVSLSTYAQTKKKPLIIQEQGSFAVGGTVITNPGTFNAGIIQSNVGEKAAKDVQAVLSDVLKNLK